MQVPGHTFLRPEDEHLFVEHRPVDGKCAACGAAELAEYPVLSEGGWWNVRKCQRCLTSASREPGPRFCSYVPPGSRR
jgi:vanillate/4-hydroxybenzoate decarboxylase subunit D